VERYFTCTAEGNGESFNIQSNTPSAGNKIVRKIWYKNEAFEATDVNTWTLVHTFADNATYASTTTQWAATLEAQTYGKPPFTLAISWQDIPLFTGLLDTYSGAAAAYSVRLLDKDYAGSCIRVRRASDNTEQDIGFTTSGDFDTSALTTFCTGTNGFIRTWYDQSGNANNLVQTTAANQPKIYDSSTGVVLENSKAALQFDGSNDTFTFTEVSDIRSLLLVARPTDTTGNGTCFVLGDNNTFNYHSGDGGIWLNATFAAVSVRTGSNYLNGNLTNLTTTQRNSAQTSVAMYHNGTATGSQLFQDRANAKHWTGAVQEFVIYPTDQSSNRTGIEQNINDYFSIY
jgi:hypothetical protein